ncbi:MAG TPA: two-component sensor histidine kinase, partial [Desulfovibrio sp.]|nr:two-component sensor histidine kinase [Desulfovibrio sp.]
MPRRFELPGGLPFGFARFLSWVSLVLILASSIVMSVVITDSARNTMFRKQQEFASLLAENLNHQIYRRFTLPTLMGAGRIALRQPVQYERLDQLVQSVIHGLQVSRVRIYDHAKIVSYSTDRADLGRADLAGPDVAAALRDEAPSYSIDADISFWRALFTPRLEPGSFILRTIYPLRVEGRLGRIDDDDDGPIMGMLEMTQDITNDTQAIIAFQWLIIGTASLSSLVLFGMLLVFIRRAERVMAERMQEKQRLERELHQHEKLAGMGR